MTTNIYDMADTWNDAGTIFTAIKMNVTDTASDAASLLMDLQVGGSSKFSVGKGAGAYFSSNLFEQRNSTNAQEFRLYNTYTDASNYERLALFWDSNVAYLSTRNAGTGAGRDLAIQRGGSEIARFQGSAFRMNAKITVASDNNRDIGGSGARFKKLYCTALDGGALTIDDLPTSDPTTAGQLWNDSGTIKVSAG